MFGPLYRTRGGYLAHVEEFDEQEDLWVGDVSPEYPVMTWDEHGNAYTVTGKPMPEFDLFEAIMGAKHVFLIPQSFAVGVRAAI